MRSVGKYFKVCFPADSHFSGNVGMIFYWYISVVLSKEFVDES